MSLAPSLLACGSRDDSTAAPTPTSTEEVPSRPPPTFRVAIVTDPKGYLAPCGCTSRPLGGIDRMAALVRGLEADGIPTLSLAAGSLFLDGVERTDEEGMETDRWRAETMVEVWNALGFDAATPGRADFTYGVGFLDALVSDPGFPLLASNARVVPAPAGRPPLRGGIAQVLGGTKVGIVGAMDLGAPSERTAGLGIDDDAIASLAEVVSQLRATGAEVVIALASGDRAFANRVAGVNGVDFVVRGGLDQADPLPPARRGRAHLLHAGHQGQGVLVLEVHRRGPGSFVDASAWTRRAAATAREAEAVALGARIAEWERDPAVRPADLAEQQARLRAMRAEIAGSTSVALPDSGNAFVAEWHELDPEARRDASVAATLERFDVRVNDHNREAFANVLPPPAVEGAASYVGSATCGRCHAAALTWWQGHPHGRAYATLVDRHKEFHLDCVGCHVTGYNRPGGSNVTHHLDGSLVNVGCESCHGPGSLHAAAPTATPRTVVRETPEGTCVECHNDEHSDLFEFDAYRRRLIAPGHGAGAGS